MGPADIRVVVCVADGAGVVVYSMTDVPLGFGTSAKSTNDARKMDPGGIVVFHQVGSPVLLASPMTSDIHLQLCLHVFVAIRSAYMREVSCSGQNHTLTRWFLWLEVFDG